MPASPARLVEGPLAGCLTPKPCRVRQPPRSSCRPRRRSHRQRPTAPQRTPPSLTPACRMPRPRPRSRRCRPTPTTDRSPRRHPCRSQPNQASILTTIPSKGERPAPSVQASRLERANAPSGSGASRRSVRPILLPRKLELERHRQARFTWVVAPGRLVRPDNAKRRNIPGQFTASAIDRAARTLDRESNTALSTPAGEIQKG